jgi:hypothetical protein
MSEPIEDAHREKMNNLAKALDNVLNGPDCPTDAKTVGFFLTVFNFNDDDGKFNYISNADTLDVRAMLRDVLARLEGRMSPPGNA